MNTVRINGQDYTSSLSDTEIAFMGNLSLPTTAQTLSGAIAEHENDISELNSNLTLKSSTTALTAVSGVSSRGCTVYKFGRILVFDLRFDITSAKVNQDILFNISDNDYKPLKTIYGTIKNSAASSYPIVIGVTTDNTIVCGGTGAPVSSYYYGQIIAVSAS